MDNMKEMPTVTPASTTAPSRPTGARISPRMLYVGIGVVAVAGAALGWDWLVAVGLSALIISLLPCLLMCALGICAMRMCQKGTVEAPKAEAAAPPPVAPVTMSAADEPQPPAPPARV